MPITTTMRVDEYEERFIKCIRAMIALGWMDGESLLVLERAVRADYNSPVGRWLTENGILCRRKDQDTKKGGGK